ncbi:uncharacterized protein LOC100377992 [Saccoglossus kowalevskii]|uniref:Uncharacterized protein LOC100377992 n=1 Tax=Saccoglossus kowalevskii TaxID=10224 RepID=A0ABM0GY74_SACKO|nr:PREDICTED: uncharacterized protein LOC100377992 [Saccoglossus kowalevskii]
MDTLQNIYCAKLVLILLAGFCISKDIDKNVRLFGGESPFEGRVEILRNGYWTAICIDDWDLNMADFVCQHLGISTGAMSLQTQLPTTEGVPVMTGGFRCDSTSTKPSECFTKQTASNRQACRPAGVKCNLPGYIGCAKYRENYWGSRSCKQGDQIENDRCDVSISGCIAFCRKSSFTHAGIIGGNECRCLATNITSVIPKDDITENAKCDVECAGEDIGTCGGSDHISVYSLSLGACSSTFRKSEGVFASPGFPGNYPPTVDCNWIIHQPREKMIELTFFMMNLADPDDVINVIEENASGEGSVTTILQASPNAIRFPWKMVIRSNLVKVRFVSNGDRESNGFIISFKAVPYIDPNPIIQPDVTTQFAVKRIEYKEDDGKSYRSRVLDSVIYMGIVLASVLFVVAAALLVLLRHKRKINKANNSSVFVHTEKVKPNQRTNDGVTENSNNVSHENSQDGVEHEYLAPQSLRVNSHIYAEIDETNSLPENHDNPIAARPKYYVLEETSTNNDIATEHAHAHGNLPAQTLPSETRICQLQSARNSSPFSPLRRQSHKYDEVYISSDRLDRWTQQDSANERTMICTSGYVRYAESDTESTSSESLGAGCIIPQENERRMNTIDVFSSRQPAVWVEKSRTLPGNI